MVDFSKFLLKSCKFPLMCVNSFIFRGGGGGWGLKIENLSFSGLLTLFRPGFFTV